MLWFAYDIWRAKDQAEAELAAESPMILATYARPFFQNAARMNALRRVLVLGLVAVAFWLLWSAAENVPA
jgi:hypothetical protein